MNDTVSPPPAAASDASGAVMHTYIARQPIVDRKQHIIGYELFARDSATAQSAPAQHTVESDSMLLFNALSNIGAENLFGEKLAFINCVVDDFKSEHLDMVFPERIVLEVPRIYGDDAAAIAEVAALLKPLRDRGFRLAAGPFAAASPYAAWLPLLSFIKADVQSVSPTVALALQRKTDAYRNLRLVAERVETPEQFKTYFDIGFHGFQGYYFARPQTVSAKVVNPAYANVLQLMNLVMRQAELNEIEQVLKRDPALSFKLLRYINSSGFGLMSEVTSFRHAAAILGYKKLFRWLALLLATVPGNAASPAIARTAITRARMMELLVKDALSAEDADNAFIVGIFSLLDLMLGVPMDKALAEITLPESVVMALLHDRGVFGSYLQLARAVEQRDFDNLDFLSSALGLPGWRVSSAHLAALSWVEQLGI
jgi:EAL and modified HD-GYP domain-containing signal transduction protein